ncbi:PXMP2/4 family protein 4-like isoform X1 [Phoenix dactylifera]|uniref:PXMP2/4 family protein 4-like isoform X1 n=1 Tax=Phoenix dactylifera TaxID=42345 RepID=A0A8B7BX21_PHODC|nr:PXMP2/4 family protein 4-like isoform X1 [Phoenix dactylifera]
MSGGLLRSGGRHAHQLLLHHSRPSLSDALTKHSPARAYVRTHLLSSKFKESSSHFSPASPSLFASSLSSPSASAAASFARNGFVKWYLRMIKARPVLTKSLTSGAIFVAADASSQMITLPPFDSFDLIRTLRMAGFGMLVSGPSLHLWFNFLSKILPKQDVPTTFKKMFLGQALYAPIMNAVFYSVNSALQGETGAEIIARLKRDLIPTLKSGLVYWPMCDFITFRFIPVHLQPLVSNSFSFLWTIYITYMASLQKAGVERISTD